jgi:hypothetical protein
VKRIVRVLAVTLLLSGVLSTRNLLKGGDPLPLCDPNDPTCVAFPK